MAKKNVRTRIKRSERKNIAVGAAHIKSTFTHTNARTRKGPRKQIGGKKK